jgi:hypothetical protein
MGYLRLPRRVVGRERGGELVAELGPVGDGDGIDSGISGLPSVGGLPASRGRRVVEAARYALGRQRRVPAPTGALGARPVAQPCELALRRGVEHADAVEAFERLQHGSELVRCLLAPSPGVAAAVEQIVNRHHAWWAPF